MLGKTNVKVKPNKKVQHVEYIESTGAQYIDTGFVPTANSKFELDIQYMSVPTGNLSTDSYRNGLGGATANSRFICGYNNTGFYYGIGGKNVDTTYGDTNRHTFIVDLKNKKYGMDNDLTIVDTEYSNPDSYTFLLFARNNGNIFTPDSFSVQRLYGCKLYANDVLVHDLKPAVTDEGIYYLYDLITRQAYYNEGTGYFIGNGNIPAKVGYVETTGNVYVDTGIQAENNMKMECKIVLTELPNSTRTELWLCSARLPDADKVFTLLQSGTEKDWCQSYISGLNTSITNIVSANTLYDIVAELNNGEQYLKVNDIEQIRTSTVGDISLPLNLFLFGRNQYGTSIIYSSYYRIYELKLYKNGKMVRHFIPSINADKEYCLHDRVSKTCFYSATTTKLGGG